MYKYILTATVGLRGKATECPRGRGRSARSAWRVRSGVGGGGVLVHVYMQSRILYGINTK